MARRVSKRKRPPKEKKVLKERNKIESDVFDKRTLLTIARIMEKGIIDYLDYPVSSGKEAYVFHAKTPEGSSVAVKIYMIETADFLRRREYVEGDPRFEKAKLNSISLVNAFARKEFKNLERALKKGVSVPLPIYYEKNIVVMDFLGKNNLPYPQLIKIKLEREEAEKLFDEIMDNLKKLHSAGLVHADLSPFNILISPSLKPYFIDLGQAVLLDHPKAKKFLERDISVLLKFFGKFGVKKNKEEILKLFE